MAFSSTSFWISPAVTDDCLTVRQQDAERLKEQLLYPLLVQMGRCAPAFTLELGVALPDRPFVLAVGVPDLGSEVFPAVAAFQLCRERTAAVMAPPRVLPPLYLRLYELPLRRLDDGVMAALHIILRHLPFVRLALLGKKIHCIALLQAGIAFVLFDRKYVLNRPVPPCFLPRGRGDVFVRQIFCNGVRRLPLHEQPVAEEGTVGQAALAVRGKGYFYPLMEQLKIDRTPHCCRHTCISMLAEGGVDQTIIKKIVGHSGAMTLTEKVYTHFDVRELVNAINMI